MYSEKKVSKNISVTMKLSQWIYLDVEINETERRERNKIYKENRKDHKSFTLLLKNAKTGHKEHE